MTRAEVRRPRTPSPAVPGAAAPPVTDPAARDLRAAERAENFPVAMRVLPARYREDLRAVYDVVRVIDDLGDEPLPAGVDRLAALDGFETDLQSVFVAGGRPAHPVLRALAATPGLDRLDAEPFENLIEANRQDQRVTRYQTFDQLRGYCALSADPIGRIVLAVFDATTPERVARSDDICTALQLIEHWQDVAEDRARDRVYLPAEDLDRFGVTDDDLRAAPTPAALRRLLAFETDRAAGLLDRGRPLVASLSGWARVAVAGYAAGGLAAIDAVVAADYDVLAGPPRPRKQNLLRHAVRLLRGAA